MSLETTPSNAESSKGESNSTDAKLLVPLERFVAASKKRIDRYQAFEKFRREAKQLIEPLAAEREDIGFFAPYGFYVHRGLEEASDQNQVEVGFSSRFLDVYKPSVGSLPRIVTESGAVLRYQRTDEGNVLCLLFPATRTNIDSIVSMIVLDVIADPSALLKVKTLQSHLSYLAAYMAMTSLNGAPTLWQRLLYFRLYGSKGYAEDKRVVPSRLRKFGDKVGTWVLTVACSGAALFGLQRAWPGPESVTPAIQAASAAAQENSLEQSRVLAEIRELLDQQRSNHTAAEQTSLLAEIRDALIQRNDQSPQQAGRGTP